MSTYTKQELEEIFASLPEDIQDAIYSPDTTAVYDTITARYALDEQQRANLGMQTDLLLMGIIEPKSYVMVISEQLGIPRDKAAFIAQEVNRDVLHKVRDSLKEVHGLGQPAPQPVSSPTPYMPPAAPVPPASPLEQKLGNAFRVAPTPAPIPPSVPVAPAAPQPLKDPYREKPL